jgi:hypothetical protein
MAIPWLTVLQAVPWSDVIRNAPKVADGAKKLWQNAGRTPGAAAQAVTTAPGREDPLAALQAQVTAQQAALAELQQQMQSASELIKTLAEQNTGLIRRAEALRVRLRWLAVATALLGAAAVAAWLRA